MDQMTLLKKLYDHLFGGEPPVTTKDVGFSRSLFRSGIAYIDFSITGADGKRLNLRLVEQNQNKEIKPGQLTYYAALARSGVKVAWLIDRNVPRGQPAYLGHMENGVWKPNQDQGPQKISAPAAKTAGRGAPLPVVANDDVPDFVIARFRSMDNPNVIIMQSEGYTLLSNEYVNDMEGDDDADILARIGREDIE